MIRTMTVADTDKVYRIETSSFFRPMPKKDLVSDIEKISTRDILFMIKTEKL